MASEIKNATYSWPNNVYINTEEITFLLRVMYGDKSYDSKAKIDYSYDEDYRIDTFEDDYRDVCKLAVVYNKEFNNNYSSENSVKYNNLMALDKYFDFNENLFSNLKNLAELLFKMFVEKINDYYIFIVYNKKLKIKDAICEKDNETYLLYCLHKLIAITPNNAEFKIYLATESEFDCIIKENIDDINKYDYIDLFKNSESCKKYYYNTMLPYYKDKHAENDTLFYYIIILMLNLNKKGLDKKQYSKMLYNVVKLIQH